ncbi:hypothetical protein Afil01_38480 [Actinorhabdospora filicis]|uniref:FHA domain-containing protein n=1 Tax=Actinorhabdospora filicis TaxID=1785913 RepID=A0A9W6WAY0_9ACTN|nr:FHA domain-containing protein [Actinorhabdospora filicis]GLZ79041.1 hypothetical protein Afil01_38480 [Actinorhabdospora filicis]
MPICPAGHNSATADFCDECGAPMNGAAAVPHVPPHAAAEPPTAWYTPQPSPCPECGEPLLDRFCEACGWGPGVAPAGQAPGVQHQPPLDPFGAPQAAPPPAPPASMFHAPPPTNGAPPPPPPLEPQTAFQVIEQPPSFPAPPAFDHPPSRPIEHTSAFQAPADPFGVPSPAPADPFGAPPPPPAPADPFAAHQPPPPQPPAADPFGAPYGHQPQVVAPMGPWQVTADADRGYFERICRANDLDPNTMQYPAYCPQRRFRLHGPQLLVGRRSASKGINPDIDLSGPPTDAAVSHAHALFVAQPDGRWAVVDVGSANGTFINEAQQPLPKNVAYPLNLGDRVHVGLWTTLTVISGMG